MWFPVRLVVPLAVLGVQPGVPLGAERLAQLPVVRLGASSQELARLVALRASCLELARLAAFPCR